MDINATLLGQALVFGVLIWLGLFLRDARLRKLLPFRSI